MAGFSPRLPLAISDEDGAYALNKTLEENVQQNLKMLILTAPGERIMDPKFGVGIRNELFNNNTPASRSAMAEKIAVQVSKYMPFLELTEVKVVSEDEDEFVDIYIRYLISPLSIEDILSFREILE